MTTQVLNPELVGWLTAEFQRRYEPNFAWKSAVSSILALPALRAAWPMSSVDYTNANRAIDVSGQGNHLSGNATPTFGYDNLAPYVNFVAASNQYLSRADGGAANWADITGTAVTEPYIESTLRGLTLGGWFQWDVVVASSFQGFMGKFGAVGARSYLLQDFAANDALRFLVSNDGTALNNVISSVDVDTGQWYFVVGRFDPADTNQELYIRVNSTENTNASAFAGVFDGTRQFEIGARTGAGVYMDGRASMCFLCAAALSNSIINSLFEQTRSLFGV